MEIFLAVIVVVAFGFLMLYLKYKNSIEKGLNFISELEDITEEYNATPKQVTKGGNMYIPMIQKKFPDFNNNLMKSEVKGFVKSYFDFLESKKIDEFKEYRVLDSLIDLLNTNKKTKNINNFKIHDIGMSYYKKENEQLILEYQVAFEFDKENKKKQYKAKIGMVCFYNTNKKTIKCDNCGAAIQKELNHCDYCDVDITVNSNERWFFSSFVYE